MNNETVVGRLKMREQKMRDSPKCKGGVV